MINSKREYRMSTVSVSVTDTQSDTDRHGETDPGLGGVSTKRPKRRQSRHAPIPCISPIAKKLLVVLNFTLYFHDCKKLLLRFEFYSLFSRARGKLPFWKNPSEGSARLPTNMSNWYVYITTPTDNHPIGPIQKPAKKGTACTNTINVAYENLIWTSQIVVISAQECRPYLPTQFPGGGTLH